MFVSGVGIFARTKAGAALTVVAAVDGATTATVRLTAGNKATLTAVTTTLVSVLFVPLLTSRNERSTTAVRHMKAVSRNGQYCCCAEREKI